MQTTNAQYTSVGFKGTGIETINLLRMLSTVMWCGNHSSSHPWKVWWTNRPPWVLIHAGVVHSVKKSARRQRKPHKLVYCTVWNEHVRRARVDQQALHRYYMSSVSWITQLAIQSPTQVWVQGHRYWNNQPNLHTQYTHLSSHPWKVWWTNRPPWA